MEFKSDKPIYLQIFSYVCEKVLQGDWPEEERIPSVRELSAIVAVNPNTVMRTYELLERDGIIFNRRGIGFSVSPNAKNKIAELMQREFLENELPDFFKKIQMLGISMKEIDVEFQKYLENEKN